MVKVVRTEKGTRFVKTRASYEDLKKQYPVLEEFLLTYSEKSAQNYGYAIKEFCDNTGLKPDAFLKLGVDEAREKIWDFVKGFIEQNKIEKAKQTKQALKNFWMFAHENVELKFGRKYRFPKLRKKIDEEHIPKKNEVYAMADCAGSLRDRAIILALFQSGMRRGALRNLLYGHVKKDLEDPQRKIIQVKVTQNIDTKLRNAEISYYITWFGEEATEALRAYIKSLPSKPSDETPLFQSGDDGKIGEQTIWRVVKVTAKRASLKGVWAHCLRKSFRKILNASDIDEDTKEAIMGHRLPGSRGNYFDSHDLDEIEQKYLKCNFSRAMSATEEIRIKLLEDHIKEQERWIEELREELGRKLDEEQYEKLTKLQEQTLGVKFEKTKTKKEQHNCQNGNCQTIITENDLPTYLAEGWRFVSALPSGKVVVQNT